MLCLVFLQLGFMCCLPSLDQSIIPVLNLMTQLCNLYSTQAQREEVGVRALHDAEL